MVVRRPNPSSKTSNFGYNPHRMSTQLHHQLRPIGELDDALHRRMFQLMAENYDKVTPELFRYDLMKKQLASLFFDDDNHLQGFTTYVVNPGGSGGQDYHIIFSGDTIIAPAYWGSQIMMQSWCHTIGRIIAADQDKTWYWYLMSKGHRTYMYLPLFFTHYHPALHPSPREEALRAVASAVSACLFPRYWQPEEGIVRFEQSLGELQPELIEGAYQKRNKPHVAFFLEKNPGFYRGEELVCIAPLYPENLNRSARQWVELGMETPLDAQYIGLESPAV